MDATMLATMDETSKKSRTTPTICRYMHVYITVFELYSQTYKAVMIIISLGGQAMP